MAANPPHVGRDETPIEPPRHGTGRIVRWDAPDGDGAVVVTRVPGEIAFTLDDVDAPDGWVPEVGDAVEVSYYDGPHGLSAVSLHPAEG